MCANKKSVALILSLLVTAGVSFGPVSYMPGDAPAVINAYAAQPPATEAADPNLRIISPRNINYNTDEAFIGSLERSAGFDARLSFPNTISLLVPRDGMFVNMTVTGGNWVDEGDPIATFSVVANDLEIDEAALAVELAQSAHRREIENLEHALSDARDRLDIILASAAASTAVSEAASANTSTAAPTAESTAASATSSAAASTTASEAVPAAVSTSASASAAAPTAAAVRRAELAVLEAEAHLDFVTYNGGRNLDHMQARLDDLKERSEDFTIYAPISGIIYDVVYFAVGRSVSAGQFMCRISNPEPFQLVISASNLTQLRLGAQVSIEVSRKDAPVCSGKVIGNTMLLGRNESESRAVIAFNDLQTLLDYSKNSVNSIAGYRYRVLTQQADIQNVLLVPRRAVSTESSYRFVNILEDGLSKKRYVVVGLSNMEFTQILDGIKAGDVLILN